MSASPNSIKIVNKADSRVITLRFQVGLPTARHFLAPRITLLLYLVATICAVVGNSLLRGPAGVYKTKENALDLGAPWLWLAFFTWLLAELYDNRAKLAAWWLRQDRLGRARWLARGVSLLIGLSGAALLFTAMSADSEASAGMAGASMGRFALAAFLWIFIDIACWLLRRRFSAHPRLADWIEAPEPVGAVEEPQQSLPLIKRVDWALWRKIPPTRVALLLLAAISSAVVWSNSSGNRIEPPIILLWLLSALLWAWVFAPLGWNLIAWARQRARALHSFKWRDNVWIVIAMVSIMILGAAFRFAQLDAIPSEMVNDHVVDIHDTHSLFMGEHAIFFSHGGRETGFYYLVALIAQLPGFGFDHFTLKFVSSAMGLLSLPIFFALGVEVVGWERRRLGFWTGALLAGLVAASFWHALISRLGWRIAPTPLVAALLMIYLARALRHNRRSDYVKAGLVLGFGLYTYTAVRMLPVLIVGGVAIALLIRRISWRERLAHLANLSVLAFVSFMVFLPLFHYSIESPDAFWNRAVTRTAGHAVTAQEWGSLFQVDIAALLTNIRDALLMFNWQGDGNWVHSMPYEPALDVFTGALLIVGLAAWLARMLISRDPALWLIPLAVFIMLLPTALALSFPAENPANTRASGVIPFVYLLAAFPLAVIARRIIRDFHRSVGPILAVMLCASLILLANHRNAELYFVRFSENYNASNYYFYRHAGRTLRGFADSDGTYGNAFVIPRSYHWHHRGIAIEAGELTWPNTVDLNNFSPLLHQALVREDEYQLDPGRDLLFLYHLDDAEVVSSQLRELFPTGRELTMQKETSDRIYKIYRVPALGIAGLVERLVKQD